MGQLDTFVNRTQTCIHDPTTLPEGCAPKEGMAPQQQPAVCWQAGESFQPDISQGSDSSITPRLSRR